MARTVWYDAVLRPTRFGPFRYMYYLDGDPIRKPRMIHRQASYHSVVLTDTDVIRGSPINGDQ